MKKLIVVMLILFFSGTALAESKLMVWGNGGALCDNFLIMMEENPNEVKMAYGQWLAGYITGRNDASTDISDYAGGTYIEEHMTWIIKYCEENPLDSFYYAASDLCSELEKTDKVIKIAP